MHPNPPPSHAMCSGRTQLKLMEDGVRNTLTRRSGSSKKFERCALAFKCACVVCHVILSLLLEPMYCIVVDYRSGYVNL